MLIDPATLANNLPRLEEIEKASMRLVTQAMYNFRVIVVAFVGQVVCGVAADIAGERRECE